MGLEIAAWIAMSCNIIERAAEEDWEELDLFGKGIKELPGAIGKCQNQTLLDLSSNQLTQVPAELGNLQNLTELNLTNNPALKLPPPEVVLQGTEAILAYLKQELAGGLSQWVSKLLVVGEGGTEKRLF